jgi:hypothetical protein
MILRCENPHLLQELKDSIQQEITSVARWAALCIEKYFQKVWGLLRSWRSTFRLFYETSWTATGRWPMNSWSVWASCVCVCVYGSSHDTCLAQGCDLWDHLYYRWRIDVEERSLIVLNNKFYILERSGKPWQESSWDKCHGCGFIVVWQCKAGASAQNQSCLINWYEQFSCVGPVESLCSWLCFPLFMKYKNALSSSLSVLVLGVCPWLFPQFSL